MNSAGQARVLAAIGTTGSGKSLWIKALVRDERPSRIIVWDFKREYAIAGLGLQPLEQLGDLVRAAQRPAFRIAYLPPMDQAQWRRHFELVCEVARTAGNCWLIAEELAFVTSPQSAPPAWKMITLTGRHHDMTVIGASQRPASIDKDFLGACTVIHCGRLLVPRDVRTMAEAMCLPDRTVLQSLPDLAWLERDNRTGEIRDGYVTVRRTGKRPAKRS